MRQKFITFILLLILTFSFVACNNTSKYDVFNDNKKIASHDNNFFISNYYQRIEGKSFDCLVENMSGMDTIWSFNSTQDKELEISYLINVNKGKVKLVLISPDNSISNIVEISDMSDLKDFAISKMNIKKGLNRIKIVVTEDSKFIFRIKISEGQFSKLGRAYN